MTLQEYLKAEVEEGNLDFSIRVYGESSDFFDFYIRPTNKNGLTVDYRVSGNTPEGIYNNADQTIANEAAFASWLEAIISKHFTAAEVVNTGGFTCDCCGAKL